MRRILLQYLKFTPGSTWIGQFVAAKFEGPRPFRITKEIFRMILETGQALTRI